MSTLKSPILRDHTHHHFPVAADAYEIIDIIQDRESKNFKLGIAFIFVAVSTWIVGLELVNAVLKDDTYQKPLMFACISGSCFALNLVPDIGLIWRKPNSYDSVNDDNDSFNDSYGDSYDEPLALTTKEELVLGWQISIIYLCYNIAALSGLKYTSASNQTVLSSTTSIFTLFIGSLLKTDTFTMKKIICTAVSFSGVLLVNFSDSKSIHSGDNIHPGGDNKFVPKNPSLGNALTLVGALMYSFYLIIMKVKVSVANRCTNERRLFGYVGVFTMIMAPFVLTLADISGWEKFEFPPPSNQILVSIIINGVFSYISDFTTILASLLTSPLITSLSLTSSIPITIFIDYIILYVTGTEHQNEKNLTVYLIGICSILVSVILINVNSTTENELVEQAIEHALTDAIRHDEALSPILSPIIQSRPHSTYSSPLLPLRREQSRPSKFNLGDELVNKNHSNLYTVSDDKMMVYGGNNHVYRVKHYEGGSREGGSRDRTDV